MHIKVHGAAGSATSIEVELAKANRYYIFRVYPNTNSLRVGNTVLVTDAATGLKTVQCYVSTVHTGVASDAGNMLTRTLLPYKFASLSTAGFVDNVAM